jgi:hypothetical protein
LLDVPAMKSLMPFALLIVAACAPAQVTHPTKTAGQMQVDIDMCSKQAKRDYWMDPIAALYHAYDCLEAKGYQRDSKHISSQIERALGEAPKRPKAPAAPCKVPCTKN